MADYHTKTFYGRNSSVKIVSPSKMVPYIFLSCMKRKDNGEWEDLNKKNGRTVRISIEEIICILEVLNRKSANWRGYHIYKDRKTEIYVGWEDESRQILLIQIEDFLKKLRFPNTSFMTLLLDHILTEKIEFATGVAFETKSKEELEEIDGTREYSLFSEQITARDGLQVVETTEYGVSIEKVEVKAKVKVESPKALLLMLETGEEFWIPKSTIHSPYKADNRDSYQKFMVDKWIIEKNKIIQ
jgi:hypothetical protein